MPTRGPEGGITGGSAPIITFDQFAYKDLKPGEYAYWKFQSGTKEAVTIDALLSRVKGGNPSGVTTSGDLYIYYQNPGGGYSSVSSKFLTEPGRTYYIRVTVSRTPYLYGDDLEAIIRVSKPGPFATPDWVQEPDVVTLDNPEWVGSDSSIYYDVEPTYVDSEYDLPPNTNEWGEVTRYTNYFSSIGSSSVGRLSGTSQYAKYGVNYGGGTRGGSGDAPLWVPSARYVNGWEVLWGKVRSGTASDGIYGVKDPEVVPNQSKGTNHSGGGRLSFFGEIFNYFALRFGNHKMSVQAGGTEFSLTEVKMITSKDARRPRSAESHSVYYDRIKNSATSSTGLSFAEIVWEKNYPDIVRACVMACRKKVGQIVNSPSMVNYAMESETRLGFTRLYVATAPQRLNKTSDWGPYYSTETVDLGYKSYDAGWNFSQNGSEPEDSQYVIEDAEYLGAIGDMGYNDNKIELPVEDLLEFEELRTGTTSVTDSYPLDVVPYSIQVSTFPNAIFSNYVPFPHPLTDADGDQVDGEIYARNPTLFRVQMRPVRYKVRMYREPEPIDLEKLRPTFGRLRVLVDPSASSLSKRWKFFAPTPGENG